MTRFLADEDLPGAIVRGVLRAHPDVDLVRVQDVGLSGADDTRVLRWAAEHGRVVLTRDVRTMTRHALARVRDELAMPGVFQVRRCTPLATVIEHIWLLAEVSLPGEWEGQVRYLPL